MNGSEAEFCAMQVTATNAIYMRGFNISIP